MLALAAQRILDTAPEKAFDDIAQLAQLICATPIALISLVADDRQWFKSRIGLPVAETHRDVSFCAHALTRQEPFVIHDTIEDPRFSDNPFVTAAPAIRFYAGVPLRVDGGAAIGTLCVLDCVPRTLTVEQLEALAALARRVETEMRLRRQALDVSGGLSLAVAGVAPRAGQGWLRSTPKSTLIEGDIAAGRYRIEAPIGSGGMGRVYRALDTKLDRQVALKVMSRMPMSEDEAIERFAREARALRRVTSKHVARFLDAGNLDDGAPYLALEYLEGHDLVAPGELESPMSTCEVVELAVQACEGVAAVHEAGLVHRDLKPGNLFLAEGPDGTTTIKLIDFGLALVLDDHELPGGALTQTGMVVGSPRYMSPEQLLSSRDVDATTDLWALGVIFYELLTGEHPFDGASVTEICTNIFTKKPYSLLARGANVPAELDNVIVRCLARDKEQRWQSARALGEALASFR